ncbi:MAG: hypothetical protein JKX98_12245 [Alcanivoracaceae bacterium]|nr:hypothetical protein [Alcanivoracaceae bacterium]
MFDDGFAGQSQTDINVFINQIIPPPTVSNISFIFSMGEGESLSLGNHMEGKVSSEGYDFNQLKFVVLSH